jgi:hypothetical protein
MIYGFIHVGVIGRYEKIFQNQILLIKSSGLYDKTNQIFVGVSGDKIEIEKDPKIKLLCHDTVLRNGENNTLINLYHFCQNVNESKIWYIHTKGASHPEKSETFKSVESWRKYLEFFTIVQHELCEKTLNSYDTCGPEWRTTHFCGNFWWANSSYIKRLQNILTKEKPYPTRFLAEFDFISKGNPNVKSLYNMGNIETVENMYGKIWHPFYYRNKFI